MLNWPRPSRRRIARRCPFPTAPGTHPPRCRTMPICIAKVRPGSQRAANETVTASLAGCKPDAAFGKCGTSCWPARWWPAAIATPCCRRHVRAQGGRLATTISCASSAYGGNRTMAFRSLARQGNRRFDARRDRRQAWRGQQFRLGGPRLPGGENGRRLKLRPGCTLDQIPGRKLPSREAFLFADLCARKQSLFVANSRSGPERRFLEYCR